MESRKKNLTFFFFDQYQVDTFPEKACFVLIFPCHAGSVVSIKKLFYSNIPAFLNSPMMSNLSLAALSMTLSTEISPKRVCSIPQYLRGNRQRVTRANKLK
jgi:hypothetical protein